MHNEPSPIVAWTQRVAVASLLGLIVLGLAWELWLAPTGNRTWATGSATLPPSGDSFNPRKRTCAASSKSTGNWFLARR